MMTVVVVLTKNSYWSNSTSLRWRSATHLATAQN